MFRKAILWNFQCWKKLVLKFGPGVTTLLCPTDGGKSAALRFLRWMCLNKCKGKFTRTGAKQVLGKLFVDDHVIGRIKGKRNEYSLDGHKLKAVGINKVPRPIAKLLRVTEDNFQRQHDKHYWLTESPGQVSRRLNEIINLDDMDETLDRLASDVRRTKATVSFCKERLAKAEQEKEKLSWARKMQIRLEAVQQTQDRLEALEWEVQELGSLTAKAIEADKVFRTARKRADQMHKAIETGKRVVLLGGDVVCLEELLKRFSIADTLTDMRVPNASKLKRLSLAIGSKAAKINTLNELVTSLSVFEEELCLATDLVGAAEKALHKATKGKRCPLCQQVIKSKIRTHPS